MYQFMIESSDISFFNKISKGFALEDKKNDFMYQ